MNTDFPDAPTIPLARPSLQAFQEALLRKLADSAGQGLSVDWLGVGVGTVRLLLALRHLGEIVPLQPLQRLPRTVAWVLGVASVRGQMTVVADTRRLLDLPVSSLLPQLQAPRTGAPLDAPGHWLSLNPALGVHAALQVDRLWGLHGQRDLSAADMPSGLAPHPALTRCWKDGTGQTWLELDLTVLASWPAFLELREPGAFPSRPPLTA
ncbi:MAG: chemotaxis protein CheW [Serpentinimonas sp.]|jgi:twitching motility protein PilI|nr:chemotaxis protein CheW [Serpentinimonas sp.]